MLIVVGGAMVADAYIQSAKVYETLKRITPELTSARQQLAQGKVPANDELGIASGLASEAQSQIDRARFTFGWTASVPFFGRPVQAVQLATVAADEEAQAATIVRDIIVDLLGPNGAGGKDDGSSPPVFKNGVIDVDLIASLTPRLEQIVAHLRAGDQAIQAIPTIPFVGTLDSVKAQALQESSSAVALAQRSLTGIRLLPSFLGADQPKTYYIALQNNSDQRGTGGAVLAYAIMVLDHGRIHLDEAGPITKIDNAKGGIYVQQPPGVAWYTETTHVARRLANSANYSPDFPAAAQTWAAMVRKQTGQTIDGVIAIDPYAIAAALTGQRGFHVDGYADPISSDNIVKVAENDQYRLDHDIQRVLPGQLVTGALTAITHPHHFLGVVKSLGAALADKRVQIWSADAAQSSLLTQLGWDGAIGNPAGGDYLNLAYEKRIPNKIDYYVQENISYTATVQPSGAVASTYHLQLVNDVPPDQPRAIVGGASPYGVDLAMMNLYVPRQARDVSYAPLGDFPPTAIEPTRYSDHVQPKGFLSHYEGGFRVFTKTILAWPGSPGELTFHYTVPRVVKDTPDGKVYVLTVQHQPMANPANLAVKLMLPKGAEVTQLPTGWTLNGNVLTFHGPVQRDFVVEVHFR